MRGAIQVKSSSECSNRHRWRVEHNATRSIGQSSPTSSSFVARQKIGWHFGLIFSTMLIHVPLPVGGGLSNTSRRKSSVLVVCVFCGRVEGTGEPSSKFLPPTRLCFAPQRSSQRSLAQHCCPWSGLSCAMPASVIAYPLYARTCRGGAHLEPAFGQFPLCLLVVS